MKKLKQKRIGHPNPKLQIIVAEEKRPNKKWLHEKGIRFTIWMLQRLSLVNQEVAIDYVDSFVHRHDVTYIFMGEEVCKTIIKEKFVFKNHKYSYYFPYNAFICGSILSAIVGAAESYRINRLFKLAAEWAELKPEVDFKVPMFTEFIEI